MLSPTELAPTHDHMVKCDACLGSFPTAEMHRMKCQHAYCLECLRAMFMVSFGKDGSFPPCCCNGPIELTSQLAIGLGNEILSGYLAKRAETKTMTNARTYCSNPECGAFISDDHKLEPLAVCQQCGSHTCTKCSKPYHQGDCPVEGSKELEAVAAKEGWKHCYKCNRLVEKLDGCDSVVCPCGASFCYKCSAPTSKCSCKKAERGEEAEEGAEQNEADTAAITAMSQPAAQLPQEQQEPRCTHHSNRDRIDGVRICAVCGRQGLSYVLQCRRCGSRACWDCAKARRPH
ncbi:hypothetical protein F5Y06DRAFT_304583 [Hypoxylon sp. FL0890]|nr:hypothetical protein F5Y06DRAFT_304583 [Hypoxylon sp. FL0890]